ncbi:nucleotidyltransferase domain-containing protein [Candidatus Enterococcus willemsii]|uniref:Nucleotidyltransferase n=1 Tax=Candidatus Enterococcus willemsii TaxID=1857215 RepID=A0ABQ6Z046_9ENTE|nr:nucleotidyltransferase domain-containing protein [Enterococcus sp. CU12B]KAF1304306.1 nucleotidyltransferase [Enterococcus sp. CU12B]
MESLIKQKIQEIEQQEQVKILLAVESGSRAWGFESPDSDYDVRFIYLRSPEDYLKLEGIRDVIEWQLDDTLDISGWDLQKTLKLLYKSNPTLYEWCHSPIVYQERPEVEQLKELLPAYFSTKKMLYHYWHMAKTNYRTYLQGDLVKVKKYFYVLRPILAGKWVITQQTHPPMAFTDLIESQLEADLKPLIYELMDKKRQMDELDLLPRIDILNNYIEENLIWLEQQAKALSEEPKEWHELNQFFLDLLQEQSKRSNN